MLPKAMSPKKEREGEGQVLIRTRTDKKLARPPMYKVLLHNDDYTPREFVVMLLQQVFRMSESDATSAMLYVHNHGVGVVGLYPFSVAETKVAEVMAAAEQSDFPLMCTLEPEGTSGDRGKSDDDDGSE